MGHTRLVSVISEIPVFIQFSTSPPPRTMERLSSDVLIDIIYLYLNKAVENYYSLRALQSDRLINCS